MTYSFLQNGDTAVTVCFRKEISKEVNGCVTSLCSLIENQHIKGVIELVPTFASLTVFYDCTVISSSKLKMKIEKLIGKIKTGGTKDTVVYHIPVCYDEKFALDMESVCEHTGLSKNEVIELHTKEPYLIYMLGFLPGFAYLGGLDRRLCTPRLDVPRIEIFKGAVGIGGEQTGIYPIASPGGWRLIGKTPVNVYDSSRENPILYKAGDYIKFFSIDIDEYYKIEKEISAGTYCLKTEEVCL